MPVTEVLIQEVTQRIDDMYQLILSRVSRKTGIVSLGTAIALFMTYSLYQRLNKSPKHMRHLPYIRPFKFYNYALRNKLYEDYSNAVVMPLLEQGSNGIYMRPSIISWTVMVANPLTLKQLLFKPEHVFPKKPTVGSKGTLLDRYIGGPNILLLSGPVWRKHKKIANPAFQRSMPVKTFGDLTVKMFNAIEKDGLDDINVFELFERWTLDAIGIAGFDFDFNALGDKNNKWVKYYDAIKDGLINPIFILFPKLDTKYLGWFKERREVHAMLTEFIDNIDGIIDEKRRLVKEKKNNETDDGEKDLLTLMIESEAKGEGEGLSNEELQSNLCIFFLAGHDTTANTLGFVLYELAINPEIQEKARKEAIKILGDAPENIIPTVAQTKEFLYINMIIKETLRRHPPVYNTTSRIIQEDMNLAGNFVPKGTEWAIDIYSLHHNPNIWKDPYRFNPDRFSPGGEADQQEGITWVPFSHGQRQCIGMNFSLAEQRVVLSMLLRKYRWSLPKDSPHQEKALKGGVGFGMVVLHEKLKISFEKLY